MWDEPPPPPADEEEPAYEETDPSADANWTDGQLMRLENEFRKAQRAFAYHPVIGIRPLAGDPPHEYQIDYRVRTLVTDDAGDLQYQDEVSVHVWFPPGFPNQPPVVRPMAAVFHPNVAWEGVYLTRPWQPTDTLVAFAGRIGELLTYRSYDPESVVNGVAMEWLSQNSGAVPLDARSDFSPFNGGEPLGRIQRLGPATLEQIRRAMDDMRFALVAEEGAPTAEEAADFARQTRSALSLFLEGDIPDSLRSQASEFDDWCRELPASTPWWEYLRSQRTLAAAAERAAVSLRTSAEAVGAALVELERLAPTGADPDPTAVVRAIPPMSALAPLQLKLPPLSRDFDKYSVECKKLLAAMRPPPPMVDVSPEGTLGRLLDAQNQTVREACADAMRAVESAIADVDPLYKRSKSELAALEQVAGWREYMDMFSKARAVDQQAVSWGADGLQAFFLNNGSGEFGPYQFEEPLELGDSRLVVRSMQRGQLEIIDAATQQVIGRGSAGTASASIGQTQDNSAGHAITFRLTDRCDDLVVQISFIQQQTIEALSKFQRPIPGATSWCGTVSTILASTSQQQNLRESNRKAAHRWKALVGDLAALSRFKERLATHHLAARMREEVPRIIEQIKQAQTRHKDATAKIALIMGKSSRDMETDRLIIPPKLAKSYSEELGARDDARQRHAALSALLKQIAREVAVRVGAPRWVGRPEVPAFRVLRPMSEELAGAAETMSDAAMREAVAELGGLLNVQLPFNAPPPPAIAVAPAGPTRAPRPSGGEETPGATGQEPADQPPPPAAVNREPDLSNGLAASEAVDAAGAADDLAASPIDSPPSHEEHESIASAGDEDIIEDFFGPAGGRSEK